MMLCASLVDGVKGGQIRLPRQLPRVYMQRVQQVPHLHSRDHREHSRLPGPSRMGLGLAWHGMAWHERASKNQRCMCGTVSR